MKKFIQISVAIVVVIAAVVVGVNIYESYMSVFTPEKWDKHTWSRMGMIDSLEEQYKLEGMTYDEVINLLGHNGIAERLASDDTALAYYIDKGICDEFILFISFDDSGVVSEYGIMTG